MSRQTDSATAIEVAAVASTQTSLSTWFGRAAITLAATVCLVALGSSLLNALATRRGYQTMAVVTPSMRPKIKVGDLVVSHQIAPNAIKVGDVISFREPLGTHLVFTHRVVGITQTPYGPEFTTKGDANKSPDPWTIHYTGTGWHVVAVVRSAGHLLVMLRTPAGRLLTWLSLFGLMLALVWPLLVGDDARPIAVAAQGIA